MRVGLIDGPGHHGPAMLRALRERAHSVLYARPHPGLALRHLHPDGHDDDLTGLAARALHDGLRKASSALAFRARKLLPASYDFDLYTRLFGRIAADHVAPAPLVVAFSFVALSSLRSARARGARAVLELPSSHVDEFVSILEGERARLGLAAPASGLALSPLARARARLEYEQAERIDVLSSYARQTLVARGVDGSKISVTPLGIDLDEFSPGERPLRGPLRVLFVGRVELAKGVHVLLEAVDLLRSRQVELTLIGALDPEMQPFLQKCRTPFRLEPPRPREQLAPAYAAADVLVLPTLSDSFGLVLLEAMACATPVITTDRSGGPDILREGVDGHVVPAGSPSALAEALERVAQSPPQRHAMGQQARARAVEQFSSRAYADRLDRAIARWAE